MKGCGGVDDLGLFIIKSGYKTIANNQTDEEKEEYTKLWNSRFFYQQ